MLTIVKQLGF